MKAPPYVKCKDSGIEWLGQIPAHWDVKRNALLFDQRDERGYPDLPILNVSIANGVRLREFSDEHIEQKASDHGVYKRALAGDIAFNKMRMWQGAVGVVPEDGLVSPDYTVAVPRDGALPRYFSYLFRTGLHMSKVYWESHGIVDDRNRLYWEGFRDIGEPTPPLPEQQAIADFLDRETAGIDALVEKKERLIELLQEKRAALITHAVTKGLDPDVPMRDSGIEWLGQIPAHCETPRAQDCVDLAVGFAFPSESFLHGESDEGVRLVRGDNVTTGALRWGERTRRWPEVTPDIFHLLLKEDDIVIGMDGSKVGRNYALVRQEDLPLLLVQRVARLRPKDGVSPKYLFYSIANPRFHAHVDLEKSDPAIPHVSGWSIGHYRVILPPLKEQQAIADSLDRGTAKIDALIAKVGEAIERLKEYRTALISAAVTGKIDVREEG